MLWSWISLPKIELEHWLETFQDRIWTDDLMAELSKAGLIRVTVSQVWNKENHRLTRVFEYESEKAYKDCQKIIEDKVVPKVRKNYNTKYRNNRGIVLHDYRS